MTLTKEEVIQSIEDFLNGTGDEWDWDDFIGIPIKNPELEAIRMECAELSKKFPAEERGEYCSDEGVAKLEQILSKLRSK